MCQTRVSSLVYGSAWSNCYWFARMLLNTDQYAAPGKNERAMNILLSKVEPLMRLESLASEEKYHVCRDALMSELDGMSAGSSKSAVLRRNFRDDVDAMITCLEDVAVFLFTVRYIVLPSNAALRNIPNDDKRFCREHAAQILDTLGKAGVSKVLALWDALGVRGCLNIEREEVITEFTKLRTALESLKTFQHSQLDDMV